jgi:hypothetical protein
MEMLMVSVAACHFISNKKRPTMLRHVFFAPYLENLVGVLHSTASFNWSLFSLRSSFEWFHNWVSERISSLVDSLNHWSRVKSHNWSAIHRCVLRIVGEIPGKCFLAFCSVGWAWVSRSGKWIDGRRDWSFDLLFRDFPGRFDRTLSFWSDYASALLPILVISCSHPFPSSSHPSNLG